MSTKPDVIIGAGRAGELIDVRELATARNAFSVRHHSKLMKRENTYGRIQRTVAHRPHTRIGRPALFISDLESRDSLLAHKMLVRAQVDPDCKSTRMRS